MKDPEQSLLDGQQVEPFLAILVQAQVHQVALNGWIGPQHAALGASNIQMYVVEQKQTPQSGNRA